MHVIRSLTKLLITFILVSISVGCSGKRGDKESDGDYEIEKQFDGSWEAEYSDIEDGVKLKIKAAVDYSLADHRFDVTICLNAGHPYNAWFFTAEYSGSWTVHAKTVVYNIDKNSIKVRYNKSLLDASDFEELWGDVVKEFEDVGYRETSEIISISRDRIILKEDDDTEVTYVRTSEGKSLSRDVVDERETDTSIDDKGNVKPEDAVFLTPQILKCQHLKDITLKPQAGNHYDADNLLDGNQATVWAIDWDKAQKIDEDSFGHLPPCVGIIPNGRVSYIDIINGYCKSDEAFANNMRVKSITIMGCNNGNHFADELFHGTIDDTMVKQRYVLKNSNREYDYINIIIDDVYPGRKYTDVCISEINLYGKPM